MKLCLDIIKVEPKDVKLNWDVNLNEFCKSIKRKKYWNYFKLDCEYGLIAIYKSEDFGTRSIEKHFGVTMCKQDVAKIIANRFVTRFLNLFPKHLDDYDTVVIEDSYYRHKFFYAIYSVIYRSLFGEKEPVSVIDDMYKGYELKFYIKD